MGSEIPRVSDFKVMNDGCWWNHLSHKIGKDSAVYVCVVARMLQKGGLKQYTAMDEDDAMTSMVYEIVNGYIPEENATSDDDAE